MSLDAHLKAAQAAGDKRALIGLYDQAADTANDPNAAAFFLTHAYVFALEAGDPRAKAFHHRLKAEGREA